jgi:hypothetical protein
MSGDDKSGEVWTTDEPPKRIFIRSNEMKNIPADKVLPCYLIGLCPKVFER